MGESLRNANKKFKELFDEFRRNPNYKNADERICYIFFLQGWREGSGMTQMIN